MSTKESCSFWLWMLDIELELAAEPRKPSRFLVNIQVHYEHPVPSPLKSIPTPPENLVYPINTAKGITPK